ncbi:tripartite tricarboxylate transporter TctB family protein [Bengtsoniella intestinalis]|uniref:tripartite tricarboxylate transporter TctB family protein n=1 Tax=Bengtsoniella intestinalis TaxID=3073143 RepID=UPI00391F1A76
MNNETKKELGAASVLMVLSLFTALVLIPKGITVQAMFGSSASNINGRTMPYIAVFIIFASALTQLIKVIYAYRKGQQAEGDFNPTKADIIRLVAIMGLFILFVVLFSTVGTIVAVAVTVPAILYVTGVRKPTYYAIVYGFAGLCYLCFVNLLQIYLP